MSTIGMAVFLRERHEDARHQREVERHVALVAVAEIGEQRPPATGWLRRAACGLRNARRSAARISLRRRASPAGSRSWCLRARTGREWRRGAGRRRPCRARSRMSVEHSLCDGRVVVVQVRLMREEAVPVVGLGLRVPGPVRRFGVREDDARVFGISCRLSRPDVEVALLQPGAARGAPRWNQGCWSEVWFMTSSVITCRPRACAARMKCGSRAACRSRIDAW